MRTTLLKRWLLPASFLPLAVGAIVFLALDLEMSDDETEAFLRPVNVEVKAPAANAPVAQRVASRRARPSVVRQLKRSELPKVKAHAPVPKTIRTNRANHLVTVLARSETLTKRLHALQRYCDRLSPEQAAEVLEGLLDSPMPGDFYESTNLRLAVLGELGVLDSPRAEAALVGRLRAEVPRPERLIALELLANKTLGAGTSEIQAIAYNDHDQKVRSKARWALARQGIEVR